MKRSVLYLISPLLILIVVPLANGFQSSTEWVTYTSEAGRYSALFPKQPQLKTQAGSAKTGEKFTYYNAQSLDADSIYRIGYFDLPPDTVHSLEAGRDGMLNAVKGTLLKEEDISLGGSPGKEIKVLMKSEGLEMHIRTRYYAIEGRIYYLHHLFPKPLDTPAMAEKTVRFFDSFKVVPAR